MPETYMSICPAQSAPWMAKTTNELKKHTYYGHLSMVQIQTTNCNGIVISDFSNTRFTKMSARKTSSNGSRGVKTPQRPGSQQRVANLLAAGADLFAEKGFDAATMTEIAANAGASIGSLYQYFPAKEPLAATLHASQIATLDTMLEELRGECVGLDASQFCHKLFLRLSDFLRANSSFAVLTERRTIDPEVINSARARLRAGLNSLLAVIEPPVPEQRRPAMAAIMLHFIRIAGTISRDPDSSIRDRALEEMCGMLSGHLAAIQSGS
ncbi:TetR family transcriptional regulator [Hoeflea marina]|uniref:TetR family transcriptional regulator n=1 Tax=Hoeflea marina TaxID=274592 RepID=A0A317PSJ4_9HYPH|nr:TetR/AcrR family transcriptional regulator [Hoeflea marina]PWW03584.1 TetR family transcriptional regulator [Hoeflea marina]